MKIEILNYNFIFDEEEKEVVIEKENKTIKISLLRDDMSVEDENGKQIVYVR